ncbi:hypothetical protein [Urbifossiella limnaea]|uniref:Uncharacterized protein n=1 Tax=Urbifossiella limnaea TaxID=2528023 RepID=A0A517Y2T7_9BACT|nr:hypothetical protein [Urbifossiella limnaea]QDU24097.1 hypothetical protein ETAA1_61100 [Urbifossiella limnaea]
MLATLTIALALADPDARPEVAPPPRLVAPLVELAPLPNGYRITLSRRGVEQFRDLLESTDEKQAAALLRDRAKNMRAGETPDDATAGKLELIAFVAGSQIPALRTELRDKAGPGGAVITVSGLQKADLPIPENRPLLRRVAGVVQGVAPLLPADARDTLLGLSAMSRTTPLTWRVEPRE